MLVIGGSGFVGQNLTKALKFPRNVSRDELYASTQKFEADALFISAPSAEKWKANLDPHKDLESCLELAEAVTNRFKVKRVLHFSTVDVYPSPSEVSEDDYPETSLSYGGNRLRLTQELRLAFDKVTEVRLPGLYGPGLKKNLLFDLKNKRQDELSKHHPNSSFQFAEIRWAIQLALEAFDRGLDILNVSPAPVEVVEIPESSVFTPLMKNSNPKIGYNMRTKYGSGGYHLEKDDVIKGISHWMRQS